MAFEKLPSNSERLLDELVQAENPVQVLCDYFDQASSREDDELRGILRELRELGFINVEWADNLPYIVTLNNSARTYKEQMAEFQAEISMNTTQIKKLKPIIFISHRSTDKAIADMLVDFFSGTGIPRDAVFCSSLPGNDINEKISGEVKTALKNSVANIAILSQDYYQSAYCLNEAGILWYKNDVSIIPVALPEITSNNMYGFLNNEYKLRRLESDTDISYIYDVVREAVSAQQTKTSVITYEIKKLIKRYNDFLSNREEPKECPKLSQEIISEITTDDERIVLYYILTKNVRKVSKGDIINWLNESEIYDVNVDNAFDLLSSFNGGKVYNDTLELGIEMFRKYSANAGEMISALSSHVDSHVKLASNTFKTLWDSDAIDSTNKLFVAYIIDEKIRYFGDRWMAKGQIESIKQWEHKYELDDVLSSNYGGCLKFFIQQNLVYVSDWTDYGNPRAYTLCLSLQNLFFNQSAMFDEQIKYIKNTHVFALPF